MILNDTPILDAQADEFGFREYADVLCTAIANTTSFPLAIGVYGPWGSGKSSFLNICRDLLGRQGFTTVFFNPWKYDNKDAIWHALIQSLLDELTRLGKENPKGLANDRIKHALDLVKKLSQAIAWLVARHAVPLATVGVLTRDDVDAFQKDLGDLNLSDNDIDTLGYRHINEFERDFAQLVDMLTEHGQLAVFVDDLDRCRREPALMALESLRLFTGNARCVFVIALDQAALAEAASAHFDGNVARGREYLEKLINFSYYLPAARIESINRAYRPKLDYLSDDSALWTLILENFKENPRRIRRFINALNLTIATLMQATTASRDRQMQIAMLLMFRQEHPLFFECLQRDPKLWPRLEEVGAGKIGRESLNDMDQELLRNDPELLRAIGSVAKRPGHDFPPPPDAPRIAALTKALVIAPNVPAAINYMATTVPVSGASDEGVPS